MTNSEDIKQALALLEDERGCLTPEIVLAAAADEDSVLHGLFEWDDSAAAHKFRIDQARTIIRSVRVVFRVDHRVVTSIAYVRDPSAESGQQGYRAVVDLEKEPYEARSAVINQFLAAIAHLRRARDLAAALSLEEVEEEFDDILSNVATLRGRFEGDAPHLDA